ncbi:hypothetical protein AQBE111736_00220 [Aquirufa beregesia]|nr:hypothetical protein [Aquirufa beregesia]
MKEQISEEAIAQKKTWESPSLNSWNIDESLELNPLKFLIESDTIAS